MNLHVALYYDLASQGTIDKRIWCVKRTRLFHEIFEGNSACSQIVDFGKWETVGGTTQPLDEVKIIRKIDFYQSLFRGQLHELFCLYL